MDSQSSASDQAKTNSKVNTTKQLPSDRSEDEHDRSSVIEAEKKANHHKKRKGVQPDNVILDFSKEEHASRDIRRFQQSLQQVREVNKDLEMIENMPFMKKEYKQIEAPAKADYSQAMKEATMNMMKNGLSQAAVNLAMKQNRAQTAGNNAYKDLISRSFNEKLKTIQAQDQRPQTKLEVIMKHQRIQTDEPSRTAMINRKRSIATDTKEIPKLKIPEIAQQSQPVKKVEQPQRKIIAHSNREVRSHIVPAGRFSSSQNSFNNRPPLNQFQRSTHQIQPFLLQDFYRQSNNSTLQRFNQYNGGYMMNEGFNQYNQQQFQKPLAPFKQQYLPQSESQHNKFQGKPPMVVDLKSFNEGTGKFGGSQAFHKIQSVDHAIGLLMNAR